jgi:hypothetical protein
MIGTAREMLSEGYRPKPINKFAPSGGMVVSTYAI